MERWKVTAVPVVEGEGRVDGGVVTLSGEVRDGARIPIAERLARAVEGVVDVRCELTAQGVGGDER
ncbi:BON domain-containing protein [Streptomyces viridochromogenes]|uniref:BON domain-containing protein n=2 Tax=Streptomyces TaxID=1883 RepID=UPI000D149097|nr:BON domain-containing protein [Streptomyces viridochromogenes]